MTNFNRTRAKSDIVTDTFVARQSGPGVPPGREDKAIARPRGSFISRIADNEGPLWPMRDKRTGQCIPKPVQHWRVKAKLGSLVPWQRWYDKDRGLMQTIAPVTNFVPMDWETFAIPSRLEDFMTSPPSFLLRKHSLASLYEFETMFPEEVSFPNFLWELREIGSLIPRIQESFVKSLSGGFLNWEFGWKPFLSDLASLGKLMNVVKARLEHLKRTFGKVTRLGYFAPDWWKPDVSDWMFPHISWNGLQVQTRLKVVRSDLRVGALHYHEVPYLNDHIGTIRAFVGALGLNNPLKTVWEALPYSFVIDWFLNIGGTLQAIGGFQDKTVPWEIFNVNWSIKTKALFELLQVNHPEGQEFFFSRPCGEVEAVSYVRSTGYPEGSWLAANTDLSPKQATLMAALLTAR